MKFFASTLALVLAAPLAQGARSDWPDLVLDEYILTISQVAADLSALAYEDITTYSVGDGNFAHPDYDFIRYYNEEPDQAVVAQKDGRCYMAFRGTTSDLDDWMQNVDLGDMNVYKDNDSTSGFFCEARAGYGEFLSTSPYSNAIADITSCVSSCSDSSDCLILTGHSQGGANANLAAVTTYSMNPLVITFGQPGAMDAGCGLVDNTRFYRYVNWKGEDSGDGIGLDIVPYLPVLGSGSVQYGFNILVGEDSGNVYYGGYADDVEFSSDVEDWNTYAHTMSGETWSYKSRVDALYATLPTAIGVDGSVGGTICEEDYPELCLSNSCVENACITNGGVTETCIEGSCEQDSDCAGDLVCVWDACATADGEVETGCPCYWSSSCASGDCVASDGWSWWNLDYVCE